MKNTLAPSKAWFAFAFILILANGESVHTVRLRSNGCLAERELSKVHRF